MKVILAFAFAVILACKALDEPVCENDGDYFPYPTNCSLYYQCSGGVAIEKECPPGLYWNARLEICDFPGPSGCVVSTTTDFPTTTDEPTSTYHSELPTDPTETSTRTTVTSTGTTVTSTGTTVTSTGTTGSTTPTTTPNSTIPTESTSATTDGPPTEASTTIPSTTSEEPATEPPGGLPSSCPAVDDPNNIIRLPHPSNCEYYYRCNNGTKDLYACAIGMHFSPTYRICQVPDEAGCDRCPPVEDPFHEIRLPHASDCHLYYLCTDGSPVLFQCRADWQFSRDVRQCLVEEEANCNL